MAQREGERDGTALRGRDTERDGEIAPTALEPPDRVRERERGRERGRWHRC